MNRIRGHYLVTGLKGLVLRDIIGIMEIACPRLNALAADTVPDALALLKDAQSVRIAFVSLGPDTFLQDGLSTVLGHLGTKVILMGEDAENAVSRSSFPVLERPFFEDDILKLLGLPCDRLV